jgi:hypothetical protein
MKAVTVPHLERVLGWMNSVGIIWFALALAFGLLPQLYCKLHPRREECMV